MAKKTPKTFNDCIELARIKFQKLFHDSILQLIHVYPLDKVDKENKPFWTLPKRAPTPQVYSSKNELHRNFISSYACLLAHRHEIDLIANYRSEEIRQHMADQATVVKCKTFIPNSEKA